MEYLKVKLWGKEIGRLVWEPSTRRTYFMYNTGLKEEIPDVAPLLSPEKSRNLYLPIYGDDQPLYQGLPPFIADSLPDSWGNILFDEWVKNNKIPRNKVTPLYKLMFIGTRGMGALEYEPAAIDLMHTRGIEVKSLYELSLKILENRRNMTLDSNDKLTMQSLLAVGTSAGGRQMKAIIAIDNDTGEIRSGQTELPENYDYYILKFGDNAIPFGEIEAAYHLMAVDAGIDMEECRLLPVEGINHFLTRRFDRKSGKKIHIQTLAAIAPESKSYEDLINVCRELSISESGIEQLFLRMVFNVMANNTDDHNKNFTFMLEEGGKWDISPAYDMTFIFNTSGTGPNVERRFSIGGKTSGFTKSDLLDFAKQNGIKNAQSIISRVAKSLMEFNEFADKCNISQPWRGIIQKTLTDNLISFGYIEKIDAQDLQVHDKYGRLISNVSISVNAKQHIVVSAMIDENRKRIFIRPNMDIYSELMDKDIINFSAEDRIKLIETLFQVK